MSSDGTCGSDVGSTTPAPRGEGTCPVSGSARRRRLLDYHSPARLPQAPAGWRAAGGPRPAAPDGAAGSGTAVSGVAGGREAAALTTALSCRRS
jgi:hypothetical protein